MTHPSLEILCKAFRVKSKPELEMLLHDGKKSLRFIIDGSINHFSNLELESIRTNALRILSLLTNLSSFIEANHDTVQIPSKPKHLVLIDDDPIITLLISNICKLAQIQFSNFYSQQTFLDSENRLPRNAMILVDWHMEGSTTEDLLNTLKTLNFTYVYLYTHSPIHTSNYPIQGKLPKTTEWMNQWIS